jgi:hypothetical protein
MTDIDSNVLILGAFSHVRKVVGTLLNRRHHVLGFVSSRPATDSLEISLYMVGLRLEAINSHRPPG